MDASPYFEFRHEADADTISLKEDWTFDNANKLEEALQAIEPRRDRPVIFQCGGLQSFDFAGAWILLRRSREFEAEGRETSFRGFKAAHFKFLKNITEVPEGLGAMTTTGPHEDSAKARVTNSIESFGRSAASGVEDIGRIAHAIFDGVRTPSQFALAETLRHVEHTGLRAVPIISLVSFLMGVVLAYQGANQLVAFGAEVFVADLVAVSMVREMGVLLTGIMVAGRSGSAFAASIGVMQLNEEIDAMRVMGLNPNQLMIAPRVMSLLITLPLLSMIAMLAGIAGGLALSSVALQMPTALYLERAAAAADLQDLFVGLIKAPVFALLIAAVGTLRGMQVNQSADQLGRLTTTAVVQSVFLIILADAVFTIVFVRLGL